MFLLTGLLKLRGRQFPLRRETLRRIISFFYLSFDNKEFFFSFLFLSWKDMTMMKKFFGTVNILVLTLSLNDEAEDGEQDQRHAGYCR